MYRRNGVSSDAVRWGVARGDGMSFEAVRWVLQGGGSARLKAVPEGRVKLESRHRCGAGSLGTHVWFLKQPRVPRRARNLGRSAVSGA